MPKFQVIYAQTLKGDLNGFWSVMISGNWRIILRFKDGDAYDIDLVDYH